MHEDGSGGHEERGGREASPLSALDAATHRALASPVRRRVLSVVLADRREWTRRELAAALRVWDRAGAGEPAAPTDRDRLVVELHHDHLPRLDQASLLSYDGERGVVTPVPVDDAVERTVP